MNAPRLLAAAALMLMGTSGAQAQGVRGSALTTARYFELRPLRHDTVAFDAVERAGDGTYRFEGRPISCAPDSHCVRYLAADTESAVALTQDVGMTAWGLGVEGLSATVQLRARATAGGCFDWPRSDDPLDVIHAYAEFVRGDWRARGGRLLSTSGLGFNSFDGASVYYAPGRALRLELFGGRSLARGVYEPRHEVLAGIERFFPERNALIFGGMVAGEPWAHTSVAARYQREIWTDRSALVSERGSVDIHSSALAPVRLAAGLDYDFAFGHIGKANLNVGVPLADGRVMLEAVGSRYVPYFELWTIWGYFSPVAYHEIEGRAAWRTRDAVQLRGSVGYRRYGDTHTTTIGRRLPDDAVFATLLASWTASPALRLDGSARVERGFGAYLGSGDVSARWSVHERVAVTVDASAFQQIEEFRLGDGVVLGGGAAVDLDVTTYARLSGGAHVYRQSWDNRAGDTDWNQVRAFASLRLGFGRDPGLAGGATP